jgi:hypothetical protein
LYIFDKPISIFYVDGVIFHPNELFKALTGNKDDKVGAKLKSNCHAVGLAFSDKQQSELIPLKTQYNASIFVDTYFKFVFRSYNKHLKNMLKKYSLL